MILISDCFYGKYFYESKKNPPLGGEEWSRAR
nr:MAG TPA: hypothetical protein [Caudoviricetes sp.]